MQFYDKIPKTTWPHYAQIQNDFQSSVKWKIDNKHEHTIYQELQKLSVV